MTTSAKRIALVVGALFAVIVIALVAFVAFLPKDAIVAELERRVEDATQREFEIGGPLSFSFWPAIGFAAENVTLSNPEGFSENPFIAADKVVFAVALLPLLGGDIEVKSLVFEGPALALESKSGGAANWTFPTEAEGQDQAPTIDDLRLDDVRFVDGRITFRGADMAEPIELEDVDASFGLESLDAASVLDARFDYRGERLALETAIAAPRALIESGTTPLVVNLDSAPLDATFEGDLDVSAAALDGHLEARGASLRRLLGWIGAPLEPGDGFGRFSAAGALAHEGENTALTGGAYQLDDVSASGDLRVIAREGQKLRVVGALTTDALNLNPYLPAPTQGQNAAGVDTGVAWTTAPLDLSGLNALNADIAFTIGALQFQKLSFADVAMRLGVADGVADARLSRISLYEGAGTARLVADARGATPRIAAELDAQNVRALPLLRDALGFETIDGRGRVSITVAGAGASQAAIMDSLAGDASFVLNDGELKGFNLASIARTVTAILSGDAVGSTSATDFAEMAATFRINNGVAATEDLRLLNPFVRLAGAGLINVGAQNLDLRIEPRAVRSIEGQGGDAAAAGLGVPFRVSGSWANPRFQPAIGDVVRNELRERAQEALAQQDPESPLGVLSTAIFGPRAPAVAAPEPTEQAPPAEAPPAEGEAKQAEAPAEEQPSTEQRVLDTLGRILKKE